MTAGPHTGLHPLRMAHSCLSCWTNASTLFRTKLLCLPGNLIWTLLTELRALQAAVILNEVNWDYYKFVLFVSKYMTDSLLYSVYM